MAFDGMTFMLNFIKFCPSVIELKHADRYDVFILYTSYSNNGQQRVSFVQTVGVFNIF